MADQIIARSKKIVKKKKPIWFWLFWGLISILLVGGIWLFNDATGPVKIKDNVSRQVSLSTFYPPDHPLVPIPNHFNQSLLYHFLDHILEITRRNLHTTLFLQQPKRITPS